LRARSTTSVASASSFSSSWSAMGRVDCALGPGRSIRRCVGRTSRLRLDDERRGDVERPVASAHADQGGLLGDGHALVDAPAGIGLAVVHGDARADTVEAGAREGAAGADLEKANAEAARGFGSQRGEKVAGNGARGVFGAAAEK